MSIAGIEQVRSAEEKAEEIRKAAEEEAAGGGVYVEAGAVRTLLQAG